MMRGTFYVRLDRFRNRVGEKVRQKAERITQTLVNGFIERSPVFSGNFRASWRVSQGVPIFHAEMSGSEKSPLPAPKIIVKASTNFPIFYITNGQPYGQMLENGWSKTQAPYGMIRITIASMR